MVQEVAFISTIKTVDIDDIVKFKVEVVGVKVCISYLDAITKTNIVVAADATTTIFAEVIEAVVQDFVEAFINLVGDIVSIEVINFVIKTAIANLKVIALAYSADCLVGKPTFFFLFLML